MPRAPKNDPERLKTLEQRLAKVQRDIRQAKALEKKQARADDARRKIITGALSEEHALSNPSSEFARVYIRLLKEYVRPDDRYLFDHTFRTLLPADEAAALLQGATRPPVATDTPESEQIDATEAAE